MPAILFACCLMAAGNLRADGPLSIETPTRAAPVDFETEILPILRANCTACHNEKKAESSLVLESPATILKGGEQGPAVVAGKGAESLLLKVAAHQQETFMPPADNTVGARPLAPTQLGLIKLWIDQGVAGGVSASRGVRWQPLPAGYQPILATAVTPDGQFAVCSRGNRLFVYHVASGRLAATLSDPSLKDSAANASEGPPAHRDLIRSLAFSASGDVLASGGFREVKLWRRPRVTRRAEWVHDAPVQAVAVSHDGRLAATGDESGRIRLWEISSGKTLQSLAAHQAAVTGIAFSPDGANIYTCSLDKSLRAWSAADGSPIGKPIETASPIQALALIRQGEWLITGEGDGLTRVWEAKSMREGAQGAAKPLQEIKAHSSAVTALAAAPSAPGEFYTGGEEALVRRWDAQTGKQLLELQNEGPVVALAVRGDGRRIASAGASYVKLWNAEDGKLVAQLQGDPCLAAKVTAIDAEVAFTKSAIALAKQDIKAYEGPERRVMTTAQDIKKAEEEEAKAQKTRDEKQAAVEKAKEEKADDKKLAAAEKALEEAQTAALVAGTVIERAKVVAERAVKNLADAQQAVAAREELLKQQEGAKETAAAAAKAASLRLRSLAFSADNSRLALGCDDGAVHFYDADSGAPAETHADHTGAVRAMAFSTDAALLTAAADRRALVCSAGSQWRLERVIGQADPAESLVDRVLALDFSADGQHLATGGGLPSRSGEVKIWNVADGRLVREIKDAHADAVFAVRFSPDGRRLATAAADRLVKVFDAQSAECLRTFAGHTAHVLGASWSGDGKMLASCGGENVVKLWDVERGLPLRTLKGTTYQIGAYKREVTAVSFIGRSEQILAASGDGTVRLHRTSSDNDILTFSGAKGYQYSAAVTPDGQTVVVGGSDGTLRVWSGHNQQPKQVFPTALSGVSPAP